MSCKNRNLSIRNLKLLYFKCPLAHLIMNNLDGFLSIRNCFHRIVKLFNGWLSHVIGYKWIKSTLVDGKAINVWLSKSITFFGTCILLYIVTFCFAKIVQESHIEQILWYQNFILQFEYISLGGKAASKLICAEVTKLTTQVTTIVRLSKRILKMRQKRTNVIFLFLFQQVCALLAWWIHKDAINC